MCFMHFYRVLRTGSPERAEKPTPAQRFWEKVEIADGGGCWIWTGGTDHFGHGNFRDGRVQKAHRWAWLFLVGAIAPGAHLDHLCREPRCVRPEHLEPVTAQVNVRRGRVHNRHLPPTPKPNRKPKPAPVERFWARVAKTEGCWLWTGYVSNTGHAKIKVNGKMVATHRFAYELLVGPIPEGMVLDHICRTPACVNPAHLEPVTQSVNAKRGRGCTVNSEKTHCPQGHPYDETNTYRDPRRGARICRTCARNNMRGYRAAERGPEWQRVFSNQNRGKTHCKYGHPFDEANTFYSGSSERDAKSRRCRICHNAAAARARQKARNAHVMSPAFKSRSKSARFG